MLDAVTGIPAASFLDLTSLSLSLSSGSGSSNELTARRTSRGAGRGAGVPSHCGVCGGPNRYCPGPTAAVKTTTGKGAREWSPCLLDSV